jgi:hypothetical protein
MAISLGIVALLSAFALYTRKTQLIFVSFMSFPLLLLTINFDVFVHYAQPRSSRNLAEHIPATLTPTTELVCMECLPNDLPFYVKRLVTVLTRDGHETTSNYIMFTLNSAKPWPDGFVPITQWSHWLSTRTHPIYLIADKNHLTLLKAIAVQRGVELLDLGTNYLAVFLPMPLGN